MSKILGQMKKITELKNCVFLIANPLFFLYYVLKSATSCRTTCQITSSCLTQCCNKVGAILDPSLTTISSKSITNLAIS